MHFNEREAVIMNLLEARRFVSFRELELRLQSSPATIRRDLDRLESNRQLERVRGGAKWVGPADLAIPPLAGTPFRENVVRNQEQKQAIGKRAAQLCTPGEGIMLDGGSTTLTMCAHLAGLNLQILTNSLHIVQALIAQNGTRVLVPSGAVFPEQNIILSLSGDDNMPPFYAPKYFLGAASVGPQGLMQADVVLVAAERRLIERAQEIVVLVDSSKFDAPSGNVVCSLDAIDILITDRGVSQASLDMLSKAQVEVILADLE